MSRSISAMSTVLAMLACAGPAMAQEDGPVANDQTQDIGHTALQRFDAHETELVVAPGIAPLALDPDSSGETLLRTIAIWLSSEFNLPAIDKLPTISFASAARMVRLRHRGVPSDHWNDGLEKQSSADIVAIYDDETETIYLPEGWSGATPTQTSVLVHEMVHHMQNLAGETFACAAAREEMAFEAQQRWLHQFGQDLQTAFELDAFTLLVRTKCGF